MTLPGSWHWVSLEELIGNDAPIVYGIIQAGPEVPNGVPYIRPTELLNGGIDVSSLKRTSALIASKYTRSTLKAGDIVLAIVGTIGKLAIVPPELDEANITQSSARLRPPGFMPSAYLAAALRSPQLRAQFDQMEFGVAVRRLNIAHVRALRIPVAPANEQRRIVAKIDAIFEQTRAAKARLERLPALLERLKRSILAAAFRGDLTKDWRAAHPDVEPAGVLLDRFRTERRRQWEDVLRAKSKDPTKANYESYSPDEIDKLPSLPPTWAWAGLSEVAELQLGQRRAPEYEGETEFPYVRAANITWRGLDLSDVKTMGFVDTERLFLRRGDVVLSEASGSAKEVGKPGLWRDEIPNCCFQATVLRLRPEPKLLDGEWLYFTSLADAALGHFAAMAPGIGILHLTAERMRKRPVPVAPIAEQMALSKILSEGLARLYAAEDRAAMFIQKVERLEQVTLAKAFRGELVPQDPTDEPASLLLNRISAARPSEPSRPKRNRGNRDSAAVVVAAAESDGDATNGHHDESLDLVAGMFQVARRLTTTAIADGTGLEPSAVKKALKALIDSGQVSIEGKARSAKTYIWTG